MKKLQRLLAVAALLCASAQSHAAFCYFQTPAFSATQDSAGGVFTLNLSVGGIRNSCSAASTASLSSFELPYFSDANAAISAPAGWTYQIDPSASSGIGQFLGVATIRFTANDASNHVAYGSMLSGFTFTSAYAAVLSPYQANYFSSSSIFSDVVLSQAYVDPNLEASNYALMVGSPDALALLGNPSPAILPPSAVPETSTWLMLLAGVSIVAFASWRARRVGPRLPCQSMAMACAV